MKMMLHSASTYMYKFRKSKKAETNTNIKWLERGPSRLRQKTLSNKQKYFTKRLYV